MWAPGRALDHQPVCCFSGGRVEPRATGRLFMVKIVRQDDFMSAVCVTTHTHTRTHTHTHAHTRTDTPSQPVWDTPRPTPRLGPGGVLV